MQVVTSSRIKQWDNIKLEDGFASLELKLSKEPILGKYTITAIVGVSLLFINQFRYFMNKAGCQIICLFKTFNLCIECKRALAR